MSRRTFHQWLQSFRQTESIPAPRRPRSWLRLERLEPRDAPAAGAFDLTFGADGKLTMPIGTGHDIGNSVALQPDGKFVVAGSSFNGFDDDFAIVRYHADGRIDTSFGGDGMVTTAIGSWDDIATSVAVLADGKVIVAGYADIASNANADFAVVRYNADGSLDTSFDGDGKVITAIGSEGDFARSLIVQADGKIVVAGEEWNAGNPRFAVVRYNVNGSLDTSFDSDGKVTTIFGGSDFGKGVLVQADGRIVVAGYAFNGSNFDFAVARYNANGSLDTSFDGDGKLTTAIGGADDKAHALAVQADGKIVVAGSSDNGSNNDFALTRYNANGSLDTSFDGDGKLTTAIGTSSDVAQSVALQSGGKIVVAGYSSTGGNFDFAAARYYFNGSLDTTFDGDGKLTTAVGSSNDFGSSVAVQANGKILAAGYSTSGSDFDFAVVRYNADGSLDRLSDGDGTVTTTSVGANDQARGLAVQGDGKIVVAGPSGSDFAVWRYGSDGRLDTSFDSDGKVTTAIGNSGDAYSVAMQADGKIVVAGFAWTGSSDDFALVRYNADGSLDTSFDGDGKVTTAVGSSTDDALSVAVQADGKIVVAGFASIGSDKEIALVRYNANGSLDTSFDGDGKVTTAVGGVDDRAYAVAVQADGKIVVTGIAWNGSNYDFALVRYNANGSLDTSFDGDGKVITAVGSSTEYANSVALQADGKILAAGNSYNGSYFDFAVVRYNADGSLDNSFDGDGKVTTAIGGTDDLAYGVAVQPDGKIVVAGYSTTDFIDFGVAVVRYDSDGSLDATFDGDGKLWAIGSAMTAGRTVAVQADGMIVVAGHLWTGSDNDIAVARIRGDNRAPVPLPASYSLNEDTTLTVNTPSYYYDPDNDVATTMLLSGPAHGTVTPNPYGQFVYTPFLNYNGTDSFSYRVSDSFGGTAVGTISLVINPVNDNPTVQGDSAFIPEDSPATTLMVRWNDSSAPDDDEILTISAVTQPANGTVVITGSTVLTYQPDPNFNGSDLFSYTISDGNGGAATALVSVAVIPVNDPPPAVNDSRTVVEDSGTTSIDVLANDTPNVDSGESLTLSAVTTPGHGTAAIVSNRVSYTPDLNFNGSDSVVYTVSDGNGGTSVATLSITVTAVNDDPTVLDDAVILPEDSPATPIAVLLNDSSAPDSGESLSISAVTQGANGSVVITGGGTGLTYLPNANFNGADSFTCTVSDGNGGAATATVFVTVTSVNDPPTLTGVPISANINELQQLTFDANWSDPDAGQTRTFSLFGAPAGASISPTTGIFTWTPSESQGPNAFVFAVRVTDGFATTSQNVTVIVGELNVAPVLSGVPALATLVRGNALSFTATATDADLINGLPNTLTYSLIGAPAGAFIHPDTGLFQWSPHEDLPLGNYTFTVRVVDDGVPARSDSKSITVNVTNMGLVGGDLVIGGTSGNDVIGVNIAADPTKIDVVMNGGSLGLTNLADITGKIVVRGFGGNDKITIADKITKSTDLSGGAGNDSLKGALGDDTYRFGDNWGVDTITEAAKAGNDRFDFSAATTNVKFTGGATLMSQFGGNKATGANIENLIGGGGHETLTSAAANTWKLTGANAGMLNTLNFTGIENLAGGAGIDNFLMGTGGSLSGLATGGAGVNTLNYSAATTGVTINLATGTAPQIGGHKGITNVIGGTGSDTLIAGNVANAWSISGVNAGKLGTGTFAGIENLTGGTAADTFTFAKGASINGTVDGGSGFDTLNYAAFTTAVRVNLLLGTATSTGAAAGIENVTTGVANDILIGNALANLLMGGAGRDILIGGLGIDNLQGGAGDDVLVGGTTDHDDDAAALELLMAEWASASVYGTRVDRLLGVTGGGLNGGMLLNGTTIQDDAALDLFKGLADNDWFLTHLGESVADKVAAERVTVL